MQKPESANDVPWGVSPEGYQLPQTTRPGRVRLQVADLDRSIAWYGTLLGFEVSRGEPGVAVLSGAGGSEPLIELRELKGASPVPRHGRLGLYHFAVLLPDRAHLGQLLAHLNDAGQPFGASDHLVSEAIYLRDPDGLGVEVYADRPRSEWEHRGRQLVMATDPLDVADAMRAAGGERWQGMPAGTVIGHLHLHVGDLPTAETFYVNGLGFDRIVWSYPGALFMSAGGYHHHLGVNTWAQGAESAGEDEAKLLEWELLLPDPAATEAVAANLAEEGHPVERAGSDGAWRVRDPWGTSLRLSPVE